MSQRVFATSPPAPLDRWLVASAALTAIRFPLLALLLWAILTGANAACVWGLVGGIVVADILDGRAFARSYANTRAGLRAARRVADTVADRVVMHSCFVAALLVTPAAPAAYALVLVREAALLIVTHHHYARGGIVMSANTPSRIAAAFVAALGANLIAPVCANWILVAGLLTFGTGGVALYWRGPRAC